MNFHGKKILVTRPQPECQETAQQIGRAGGVPLLSPALIIAPPCDPRPLAAAMANLAQYRGVILTSVNGARAFVESRQGAVVPPLYAVGSKTAGYLREAGLAPLLPECPADAMAMAAMLPKGEGLPYLFLRAEEGREELVVHLTQAGCPVAVVAAYRSLPAPCLSPEVLSAWQQGQVDAVTFFSARTAAVFLSLIGGEGWPMVAVNSQQTAEPLLAKGIAVPVVASQPTVEAVLAGLAHQFSLR